MGQTWTNPNSIFTTSDPGGPRCGGPPLQRKLQCPGSSPECLNLSNPNPQKIQRIWLVKTAMEVYKFHELYGVYHSLSESPCEADICSRQPPRLSSRVTVPSSTHLQQALNAPHPDCQLVQSGNLRTVVPNPAGAWVKSHRNGLQTAERWAERWGDSAWRKHQSKFGKLYNGGFLKWGHPKIIYFNKIFHCKPSSYWGTPIYGTPQMVLRNKNWETNETSHTEPAARRRTYNVRLLYNLLVGNTTWTERFSSPKDHPKVL